MALDSASGSQHVGLGAVYVWAATGVCALILGLNALLTGCSEGPEAETPSVKTEATGPRVPHFSVRGQIENRDLSWSLNRQHLPPSIPEAKLRQLVELALARWAAAGVFSFHPHAAAETQIADIQFEFTTEDWSSRGDYLANGVEIARASNFGLPSRVFFNPQVSWDWSPEPLDSPPDSAAFYWLNAAIHEVGHVLGLDHSSDPGAVMYPAYSAKRSELGASDLAGLHSLYGGGAPGIGDLVLEAGEQRCLLRGVAPRQLTDWTLADLNGDGRAEILVWPKQSAIPTYTSYEFDAKGQLVSTRGPKLLPLSDPRQMRFDRMVKGPVVLLCLFKKGRYAALVFDGSEPSGRSWGRGRPLRLRSGLVDQDGDGQFELNGADWPPAAQNEHRRRGDLDGDGIDEWVLRR